MTDASIRKYMSAQGKKGGKARTDAKLAAARANGAAGGRPDRPAIPTQCHQCGEQQPSKRAARLHCGGAK